MAANKFDHGYALLIGVGEHKSDPALSLPVTAKDVKALQKTLLTPDLCGYLDDKDHVRLLVDEEANNSNILKGLKWLQGKAKSDPDATVVVYISSHGWVSPTDEYFLVTQDADTTDDSSLMDTALRATTFTNQLRAIVTQRLLVVLDCCHAQGMAEAKDLPQAAPEIVKGLKQGAAPVTKLRDALAEGKGRAVFCSSQGDESSYWLPNGSMSIFTYHFIEALQGAGQRPGDTAVTVSNLMGYVGKKVPATALSSSGKSQQPFFKFETMDFPVAIVRGGKGLPSGGWDAVKPESDRYLSDLTQNAVLTGSGAIAQGAGAVAVGQGGVSIGGNNTGNINTGTQISGDFMAGDKVLGDKIAQQINTGGGAFFGGNVSAGGDVVGGNQTVNISSSADMSAATSRLPADALALAKLLRDYFSPSELDGLAYELNIGDVRLDGVTLDQKAQSLVQSCYQRGRLDELKRFVRVARPNLRSQLE